MSTVSLQGDAQRAMSLAARLLAAPPEEVPAFAAYLAQVVCGRMLNTLGRAEDAIAVLAEVRAECDRHGEQWIRSYADVFRAEAELARGRPEAAQTYARAALKVKHHMHDSLGIAFAVDMLTWAAAAIGRPERTARLLGLSQQVWDTVGVPHMGLPELLAAREACRQQTRQALGDQAYQAAYQIGYGTHIDTGIAYALETPPTPSESDKRSVSRTP